jgi:hypothetical protein
MSLINEALKKAQRMRHSGGAPDPGSITANAAPPPRRRGMRNTSVVLLAVVAGAGSAVLVAAVALYFWPAATSTPPSAASEPALISAAPIVSPVTPQPTAATPAPPPPPAPAADETVRAPIISLAPLPAGPALEVTPAPEPPVPAGPPQRSGRIEDFVEAARVSGIRASTTDPKVLMNDRLFRVGDVVDRNLNLRITQIAPDELTFVDEHGFVYTRKLQ